MCAEIIAAIIAGAVAVITLVLNNLNSIKAHERSIREEQYITFLSSLIQYVSRGKSQSNSDKSNSDKSSSNKLSYNQSSSDQSSFDQSSSNQSGSDQSSSDQSSSDQSNSDIDVNHQLESSIQTISLVGSVKTVKAMNDFIGFIMNEDQNEDRAAEQMEKYVRLVKAMRKDLNKKSERNYPDQISFVIAK